MTSFLETWFEYCALAGHQIAICFNALQSVMIRVIQELIRRYQTIPIYV